MKRPVGTRPATHELVVDALQTTCPACGGALHITQHRGRWIERLDGYYHVVRRDRSCRNPICPGPRRIFHAPEDLRLALPRRTFGLDVTLAIGERHLRGESLLAIKRDLGVRGIEIDQRHTGRVFRDFLALCEVARGDEDALCARLRAQGGITLMCDGVQFDAHAPVLYLAWDAISGTPLFGDHKPFRGEDDLRSILERVKAMDVPVIAIVSDKERGLVPAVRSVFPDVPHQLCQTHFIKNAARPLVEDLSALGASVTQRATRVQRVAKALHDSERAGRDAPTAAPIGPASEKAETCSDNGRPLDGGSDTDLAKAICEIARENARVTGKAPLDPPELKRHQRLEALRELVEDAQKKRSLPQEVPADAGLTSSPTPSISTGMTPASPAASSATSTSCAASRT